MSEIERYVNRQLKRELEQLPKDAPELLVKNSGGSSFMFVFMVVCVAIVVIVGALQFYARTGGC